ncbi:unnamed protein product [Ceutorhynchus assimilis]|uniref:Uncharacterized protein n=1 Tax=Ceutorhynchus assimilis TaxID=467358 RepID=A0A9N9MA27_9CUCU|nr:unnamed protein product [Ceutorhynchus assimilis]
MDCGLVNGVDNARLCNGSVASLVAKFLDEPVSKSNEGKISCDLVKKVNGECTQDYDNPFCDENSNSSQSDALVIDETVPKKKIRGKSKRKSLKIQNNDVSISSNIPVNDKLIADNSGKTSDNNENAIVNGDILQPNSFNESTETGDNVGEVSEQRTSLTPPLPCDVPSLDDSKVSPNFFHSNPFFNESLFELSQLHQTNNVTKYSQPSPLSRIKSKPKTTFLKESYGQYLGLQPAVQFKCPKCGESGFESWMTLQEHFSQCNAIQTRQKSIENVNVSRFKLTRKVYLCSGCGTYYENWNLYVHMLEYHKRYICLYCLGMFSALNDLCKHIQSRHNLEPGIKNSLQEFFEAHTEPCYIACCECNQQFNESDNFIYHNCTRNSIFKSTSKKSTTKHIKNIIAPSLHVTGDSVVASCDATLVGDDKEAIKSDLDGKKDSTVKQNHNVANNLSNKIPSDDVINNQNNNIDKKKIVEINSNDSHIDLTPENRWKDTSGHQFNHVAENHFNNVSGEQDHNCKSRKSDQDSVFSSNFSGNNLEGETGYRMDDFEENVSGEQEDRGSREKQKESDFRENLSGEDTRPEIEPVDTRKVPKLSLKLPKPGSYPLPDPEDSDDMYLDIDNVESDNEHDRTGSDPGEELDVSGDNKDQPQESVLEENETIPKSPQHLVAGPDISVTKIELDQPLDKMDIRILLQKCLTATSLTCIYCNHSRRIAVNGRQLALHAMAEHRYSAINKSITEEELMPENFNMRLKDCLEEVESVFFNLASGASNEAVTFSHVFECFQCHFTTSIHKELYAHNRKFHSKSLLLCIMCKSSFYSYCELICHLCPGVYVEQDLHFRCCLCISDDFPSSFRLMVHLRKRHNACDVCLEMCHNQYKLSNHVWKHKLNHFCYRCGIAYRNKADITRHLFWKHGTESVLCKRCLQKKWSHVYHFCMPPASFTCEECNLVFIKAVSLKVHKRLHTDEKKHACTWEDCSEMFISTPLMLKHLKRHTDPPEEIVVEEEVKDHAENIKVEESMEKIESDEVVEGELPKPVKPKVDVYDLPELNLSESDSSDAESEANPEESNTSQTTSESNNSQTTTENITEPPLEEESLLALSEHILFNGHPTTKDALLEIPEPVQPPLDDTPSSVMQDIWDNFKNYQAHKEKLDNMLIGDVDLKVDQPYIPDIPIPKLEVEVEEVIGADEALLDHDYCRNAEEAPTADSILEVMPALEAKESTEHNYCYQNENAKAEGTTASSVIPSGTSFPVEDTIKPSSPIKRSLSSSSSSDSDSSCACGSSCSCSDSSSDNSSSSSDSSNSDSSSAEGRKKQQQRRLKRREKNKALKKVKKESPADTDIKLDILPPNPSTVPFEAPIHESDLETTETDTDEEFYDREPHKMAKKFLEEKRAQLLAEAGPNVVPNGSFIESTSRPPTPPAGSLLEEKQPKKKKKKRKKRKSEKKPPEREPTFSFMEETEVPVPPPSIPYYQQFHQTGNILPTVEPVSLSVTGNSPVTPQMSSQTRESLSYTNQESTTSDSSIRASKRRRVPNKFYGYSSDEEGGKGPSAKRIRVENNRTIPAPPSPMLVPPITIKNVPPRLPAQKRFPLVKPIKLKLPKLDTSINHGKFSHGKRQRPVPMVAPIRLPNPNKFIPQPNDDSSTESYDSDLGDVPSQPPRILTEPPREPPRLPKPQLYCYCKCPYDEVSEMIGCDSSDCQIEWFHFECVSIMVPPKGQWFCPDCRKKKQQHNTYNNSL